MGAQHGKGIIARRLDRPARDELTRAWQFLCAAKRGGVEGQHAVGTGPQLGPLVRPAQVDQIQARCQVPKGDGIKPRRDVVLQQRKQAYRLSLAFAWGFPGCKLPWSGMAPLRTAKKASASSDRISPASSMVAWG